MRTATLSRVVWRAGGTIAFLACAAVAQAQQTTVSVRVTDAATKTPIDQAQVAIAGTLIGGLTNAEGRVTIRGVPTGNQTLRVLRVGYAETKRAVTIAAGQEMSVDITLNRVAVDLSPVVVTATGSQLRK